METEYANGRNDVNSLGCLTAHNLSCYFPPMKIGERLKLARAHANLDTQQDLAEKSGVPQQTISKIERGAAKSSVFIVQLAIACNVRPEWLAIESGPMSRNEMVIGDPKIIEALRVMQSLPDYLVDTEILRLQTLATLAGNQADDKATEAAILAKQKKWEDDNSKAPKSNRGEE